MRTPAMAVAAVATLGLGLAGCQADSGVSGIGSTPDTSPTVTTSATDGQAAECLTGAWRSTEASGSGSAAGATARISGGSGITLNIQPDGAVRVDFAGMRPADFTVQVAGTEIVGQFTYAGQATGTVRTEDRAATSGTWRPVPPIDWGDVRVTVDLTQPVKARPFDGVRLGDYVGEGVNETGNVVDVHPFLGEGRYECRGGDTLVITPADGNGVTWTLTKA